MDFGKRYPLTRDRILAECVPMLLAYYVLAILVILPNTRLLRAALTPVILGFLGNAILHWDVSGGDRKEYYRNNPAMFTLALLFMNATTWGLKATHFVRLDGPQKTVLDVLVNAMDLVWSPTAIGWAHGRPNPANANDKPIPRLNYLISRFLSMITHFILLDCAQWAILVVGPKELDTFEGGSVFDASLPPIRRFICASAVTFFEACCIICGLTWTTDLAALIGVGLFGSRPERWPRAFNRPWAATSLAKFWSRGWHQQGRLALLGFGGAPVAYLTGSKRVGRVAGTFLASAIVHEIAALPFGTPSGVARYGIGGFFIASGMGVLLELAWTRVTGRRVAGFAGWLWTCTWMILTANWLLDSWCQRGMVYMKATPDERRLAYWIWHNILGLERV